MTDHKDEWLESGLLDDYTGTVEDAFFATDARYNQGQTLLLFWKMRTDDPSVPETEERFPCGADWGSTDNGKTATHTTDTPAKLKKFNNNSIYGKIIARAVDWGLGDRIAQMGGPREASVWKGLTFVMKRETFDYGGDIGSRARVMPQAVVTRSTTLTTAPVDPGLPVNTGPVLSAPERASSNGLIDTLDATLVVKMKAFAKAHDYSKWIDVVMELPGVIENVDLIGALSEESLYQELRSS